MTKSRLTWLLYAADYVLRQKFPVYQKNKKYCKREVLDMYGASGALSDMIRGGEPFAVGRLGLFELAAMRMYEFGIKKKYSLVMNNIYNCAGFFPNDISYGYEFNDCMKDAMSVMDIQAANTNVIENYFIDHYLPKEAVVCDSFNLFEVCKLGNDSWTKALKGKKVLVVTSFPDSVKVQYEKREKLFLGTDILPEFDLKTYKPLMTVGNLKDDRFDNWFEALYFMAEEILNIDFDIALLGCGAYGYPLAAEIKRGGRQAVHMGGTIQLMFGIMGKRWDGTRPGSDGKMRADVAKYYNDDWIYPIEEKPADADKVEYGPYWK